MATEFSTERFLLNVATWAEETTSPDAGAGTPAVGGSWWQRPSVAATDARELYLKVQPQDTGWLKQNTINLNVFNVKDPRFGAKGDGVTDDTAAIQAATDAAQAAGGGAVYFPPVNVGAGQFYRLKLLSVPLLNGYSIRLDNYHNITFMGDGFASKVEMFDNQGTTSWRGFLAHNGASNIRFDNFQVSGQGVSGGASTAALISAEGTATFDTNPGTGRVAVTGMYFGSITGTSTSRVPFEANGTSAAMQVTNVAMLYCIGSGVCTQVFIARDSNAFINRASAKYNLVTGGTVNGIVFTTVATNVGDDFEIIGNLCDGSTGSGATLSCFRGVTAWNAVVAGTGISGTSTVVGNGQVRNVLVRGNVITNTGSGRCVNATTGGVAVSIIGNVCVFLVDSTQQFIGASNAARNLITDNVCLSVAVASVPIGISVAIVPQASVDGNLLAFTSNNANLGAGIEIGQSATTDLVDASATGNMVIAAGANRISIGIEMQVALALNMHNAIVSMNFVQNVTSAIVFQRVTGAFLDWRGANDNNCPNATGSVVSLLTTGGVTIEGPAGPGAQVATIGIAAGPNTLVTAPTGSLCANTSGGNATTLWYKETGVGVSGGASGWLGIGGYGVTFGALSGSLVTAQRFLATGSDGLVDANTQTVEIKFSVSRPGTVRNLRLVCTTGTGPSNKIYTVRKNGVATTLTTQVTAAQTGNIDVTHSFTVVAGDALSMDITSGSVWTVAAQNIVAAIEIV